VPPWSWISDKPLELSVNQENTQKWWL
jgi:hypothetical protein